MSLSSAWYLSEKAAISEDPEAFFRCRVVGSGSSKLDQGGYSRTGDYRTDDVTGISLTSLTCCKGCILLSEIHPKVALVFQFFCLKH